MNFERGFQRRLPLEIAGNEGDFLSAKPPTLKPCIDSSRNWLGCNPTRQANCTFFDGKNKLPGCALYPSNGSPHKTIWRPGKAWNKPPIAPDGYSIVDLDEEAS